MGLTPAAYDAEELPHCCDQCALGAPAAVEVLAPVAHYDVYVEMSCKDSFPGRRLDKMTYTESRPRGNS